MIIRYLSKLTLGRIILWCYFIWYVVVLINYFDPNPRLWLTSFGLSIIIGTALVISTRSSNRGTMDLDRWQTFRLFLMPFCVSSFAALVKNRGFILVFSPSPKENALAAALCLIFCGVVMALKKWKQV